MRGVLHAILLFGLGAIGSGRILGLDNYLEDLDVIENNPWLRYVLG